ncbi:hypothetical protein [Kitasatospora sp. NPDC057015]|uniref:hypothetical protein n=1 Tax=Kitasatospora sp. NPDC057015 TaxID=3346001 RepID=UPI003631C806
MHRPEPSRISRRTKLRVAAMAGAPRCNPSAARAAGLDSDSYTIRFDDGARQTDRSSSRSFTYPVDTRTAASFPGHRLGPTTTNQTLGSRAGPVVTLTVPPLSVEFWARSS